MSSKTRPITEKQLLAYEAKRDLAAELLESVQQMKAVKTNVVLSPAIESRLKAVRLWNRPDAD